MLKSEKRRVLGIIPARAGSKRLPGKNKALLGGKALIRYAIEAALQSKLVARWVLTTDDSDILSIGRTYPDLIVLPRPDALSTDTAEAIDYVRHTLANVDGEYDYTVIVQATSPFTQSEDIDGTLRLLMERDVASAVSVVKVAHDIHPYKFKLLGPEGGLTDYLVEEAGRVAQEDLPDIFVRNGSVYANTILSILNGVIMNKSSVGYEMPATRSLDINTALDFKFAEFLIVQEGLQ